MTSMHAAAFDSFGPPEVLRWTELPMPTAGRGEVVVRVAAATVNPTDILMRSGQQAASMATLQPPFIPGMEFAGHLHQLGDGVSHLQPGQPVMGIVNPRRPQGGGACAQYVCVPAASVVPLAVGTNLVEAATIPMNGLTAWLSLELLALPHGATLLVTGGAGALGGYVIQLAKDQGLRVVADSKEDDRKLLQGLGAHAIVPRGEGMPTAVRELHPGGLDGLVDAALIGDAANNVVRDGGVVVLVRSSQAAHDTRVRHVVVSVGQHVTRTDALARLATLLEQGRLTPRVALRLPAQQADQAHRRLAQGGLRGRIVLEF
jgi:NADPH:quinone reductase-like Zn-dependent oxidoreductase